MPAAPSSEVKFEIGHVLFIDIVGYSKLLITEQSAQLGTLKTIVRGTEQFRLAQAEGKLLRLPTGDGGALVFRTTLEAPVLCALEIVKELKKHPELQVRMGIHSGPVNEITDLDEQANIAGAGINIAQRVMDCGDAGHILLSRHVAEDLEQYPRWRPYLHDLGECEVKHGVRIGVVNFYADEIGNPKIPKQLQVIQKHRARMRWTAIFSALLLFIGVAAVFIILSKKSAKSISSVPEKSIAVLPFENRSPDPNNAYFADGIQDEILTRLSKIADLKVISRTSTQRLKSSPDDLPQIAQRLGVANVLEGSVQKSGDSVRVNVQLIKAATDAHLWAESFDRQLTDIFRIEREVAKAIADTLQAKLSGAEQSAIAVRPTENIEAHDLYLKGRYFVAKRTGDDLKRAIDYFNQAIAKDPNYALAYAGLADSYALLHDYASEPVAEVLPKARAAAEKALSIDSSLAEAHVALGLVLHEELNLKEAKLEYERAIALNPNYATAHYLLGFSILVPFGQFDQGIAEVKRAIQLDPVSVITNTNLGLCYLLARRYPEAIDQSGKTIELDPTFLSPRGILAGALPLSGDSTGAIREYEKLYEKGKASGDIGEQYIALLSLAHAYALHGEREKAMQFLGQARDLERQAGGVYAYQNAWPYVALGDKNAAIDWLERSYQAKEAPIVAIKIDPNLDSLRGDPRFEKLANQIIPPDSPDHR